MKKLLLVTLVLFMASIAFGKEKGKDHPLFPRMKNHYIEDYEQKTASNNFILNDSETKPIKGLLTWIIYYRKDNAKAPGEDNIIMHYEKAIKSMGGEILYQRSVSDDRGAIITGVIHKNKKDIWVSAAPTDWGKSIDLKIVEVSVQNQ
jgi:OOP family OmpA-OmpF porin